MKALVLALSLIILFLGSASPARSGVPDSMNTPNPAVESALHQDLYIQIDDALRCFAQAGLWLPGPVNYKYMSEEERYRLFACFWHLGELHEHIVTQEYFTPEVRITMASLIATEGDLRRYLACVTNDTCGEPWINIDPDQGPIKTRKAFEDFQAVLSAWQAAQTCELSPVPKSC